MKKVLIVNGGELKTEFLKRQYQDYAPDFIIAVDGALIYFQESGLKITHIVGDFDTIAADILSKYENTGIPIERHKPQKDETDSELAMSLAMMLGATDILILGATGKRMDHTLANLYLLYLPFQNGVSCRIVDEYNEISLLSRDNVLKNNPGYKYVSFLPFFDEVCNLNLKGLRYPLDNYHMKKGFMPGLCISNEFAGNEATVTMQEGLVFCIRSTDNNCRRESL